MKTTLKTLALMLSLQTTILALEIPNHILLQAIADIETGPKNANQQDPEDRKIGRSNKEVSRYQMLPSVWKKNSKPGQKPSNFIEAREAANNELKGRVVDFTQTRMRQPTVKEIYILWNKPTYAINGRRPPKKVAEAAERFENIVMELIKK